MKTSHLLLTALLGLGASSIVCAQTTPGVLATPGVPSVPGAASTQAGMSTVPGQPAGIGTVVPSSTLPTSPSGVGATPGSSYSSGTTSPVGTGGVLQSSQPAGMAPRTTTPVRGVRRASKGTSTTPVRP
ncbi:MAG: hypothetical protein EOO55_02070 [Hymenobacter sp.]|nr:MAG: hypothetical protein EOO55_02070 [Hymenobacter sp.]